MIVAIVLALLAPAADVLTVNDDGGAQFTSIQAAIDAAQPGDTLLVLSGDYAAFTLLEPLTILGPAVGTRPQVSGRSTVVQASPVTLAGLEFERLVVQDCPGRVVLDECTVGMWKALDAIRALSVLACHDLLLSRCVVRGSGKLQISPNSGIGLDVAHSTVAITDCDLRGGYGEGWPDELDPAGGWGGPALVAIESEVVVAGSKIVGGHAGDGGYFVNPMCGAAGTGIHAKLSHVLVRGATTDVLDAGGYLDSFGGGGSPGYVVELVASTLVVSGVAVGPFYFQIDAASQMLTPAAEPWLEITGDDAPGSTRSVKVFGPPAQPGLLLLGLHDALAPLAALESPLWVAPDALLLTLWVTPQVAGVPVEIPLVLPASLVGLEGAQLHAQAVFPGLVSTLAPGKMIVTNPAAIVVRF